MRALRALAMLGLAACDEVVLIGEDAGVSDAGVDGGVRLDDAGFEDDAGVDAGLVDAGVDAGFLDEDKCDGPLEPSPWPCEDDSDYCDAAGDHPTKRDLLVGWSRFADGEAVFDMRMSAPPFVRGPSFEMVICIAVDGEVRDVGGFIGPCSRAINISEDVFAYPPRSVDEIVGPPPSQDVPLDICGSVFLSEDARTLRIKTQIDGIVLGYSVTIGDFEAEYIDGLGADEMVTSAGGEQDDAVFISVCEAQCPLSGGEGDSG